MKIAIALVGASGAGKTEVASILQELGGKPVGDFARSLNGKSEAEAMAMLSAPASVFAELNDIDEQGVNSLKANGVQVIEVVRGSEKQFENANLTIENDGDDLEAFHGQVRQSFVHMFWAPKAVAAAPAAEVAETKPAEAEPTAPTAETASAPTA